MKALFDELMGWKSIFETYVQGFRSTTLPAHLDEEPTDSLQWKRGSLLHLI